MRGMGVLGPTGDLLTVPEQVPHVAISAWLSLGVVFFRLGAARRCKSPLYRNSNYYPEDALAEGVVVSATGGGLARLDDTLSTATGACK